MVFNRMLGVITKGTMSLKLSKSENQNYESGLEDLSYNSVDEFLEFLDNRFDKISSSYPTRNPTMKDWSLEKVFLRMLRSGELLYFFYDFALKNNSPEILLNSFFTFNHINSTYELAGGYDHCLRLKPIMYCYAGNNYDLVDKHLPKDIGKSSNGHRFLIAAINLILAIRGELDQNEIENETEFFLSKKNTRFETEIVSTLLAILKKNDSKISIHLGEVTKLHKSSKWLHDFDNPIGKYLPFFSYGLYSMIHFHYGYEFLSKINTPDINIWWPEFEEMNITNCFSEGRNVETFTGKLDFINEIKLHPTK